MLNTNKQWTQITVVLYNKNGSFHYGKQENVVINVSLSLASVPPASLAKDSSLDLTS